MTPKQPRPKKLTSQTLDIPCPCGRVYITITEKDGQPFEIFARLGKSGGCGAAVVSAMTATASVALRSGTLPEDLAHSLIGISCHRSAAFDGDRKITSCADAVGHALFSYFSSLEGEKNNG